MTATRRPPALARRPPLRLVGAVSFALFGLWTAPAAPVAAQAGDVALEMPADAMPAPPAGPIPLASLPNANPAPRPPPLAGTLPDHTLTRLQDRAAIERLCRVDQPSGDAVANAGLACKFTVVDLAAAEPVVHFYDPRFYAFHDEWWWLPKLPGPPATVPDAYRAVAKMTFPPQSLVWLDGRLYSDAFYEIAARPGTDTRKRALFAGTLRHLAAEPRRGRPEALWVVELEESDDPREAELRALFAALARALPAEIGGALRLLVRPNAHQEALGKRLGGKRGWLAGRVVRYDDLVVPGRAVAYTAGVTAGTLRLLRKGEDPMTALGPNDIVLLETLPDALPPVAGIISLHEQAPQAHVNLLAAARGTPNAAAPDLVRDPALRALAGRNAPVALRIGEDGARVVPMVEKTWQRWLAMTTPAGEPIPHELAESAPWTIDPVALAADPTATAPPIALIGGKGQGLFFLHRTALPARTALPPTPLLLTTRCYRATIAPLQPLLLDLLADQSFALDRRIRLLALEGEAKFRKLVPDAERFLAAYTPARRSRVVRQVLARGGVVPMIAGGTLDPACAAAVLPTLHAHFGWLAPDQGLRFRSSSSVEDLPGFNGAGLYRSVTGFLHGGKRGPAAAILRVFASYWGYEAFEERVHADLWHLDGAMAVVVHPRFDDTLERANGVVLARWTEPRDGPVRAVVEINAQAGAVSVTNPRGAEGARPWQVRLVREGEGPFRMQQQVGSRPAALDDATLQRLVEASAVAARGQWIRALGAHPSGSLRGFGAPESSVADLEFRLMGEGWPALSRGAPMPERLVLKQLRPLSRPIRIDLQTLHRDAARRRPRWADAIPADLLPYAVAIDERSCRGRGRSMRGVRIHLDAAIPLADAVQSVHVVVRQHRGLPAAEAKSLLADPTRAAAAGLRCRDRSLAAGPRAFLLGLFSR